MAPNTERTAEIATPKKSVVYTLDEVRKHNGPDSAWIALNGKVYDVTKWGKYHPGGDIIFKYAGNPDSTDVFNAMHPPTVRRKLEKLCIGEIKYDLTPDQRNAKGTEDLSDYEKSLHPWTRDYRAMASKLSDLGFYDTDFTYFYMKAFVVLCLGLAAVGCVTLSSSIAVHLFGAACLAIFWQQAGFIFHDSLHNGVTHDIKQDGWIGYIFCNVLFGVAGCWWKHDHNMHHAYTNLLVEDPQMTFIPLFASHENELKGFDMPPIGKFLIKHQAWLWAPINVCLGQVQLYRLSAWHAVKTGQYSEVVGQLVMLSGLLYLLSFLGSAWEKIAFLTVAYCVVGVLHVQLYISHLDFVKMTQEEQDSHEFFKFQLLTSRNIDTFWWNDWFHGGLQYQVEHHLFPRMPRHNLSKAKPYVLEIAKKHNIKYVSQGFWESVWVTLVALDRVGKRVEELVKQPNEIGEERRLTTVIPYSIANAPHPAFDLTFLGTIVAALSSALV